jgi:hypothetical protein
MKNLSLCTVLLLVGCQLNQPSTNAPIVITLSKQTSVPIETVLPARAPITSTLPTSSPSQTGTKPAVQNKTTPVRNLTLQITTPQDESVVTTATITVTGKTSSGAVVSINGKLADVDAVGGFKFRLLLDEGPNTIEVVASDRDGHELSQILLVIYEP